MFIVNIVIIIISIIVVDVLRSETLRALRHMGASFYNLFRCMKGQQHINHERSVARVSYRCSSRVAERPEPTCPTTKCQSAGEELSAQTGGVC